MFLSFPRPLLAENRKKNVYITTSINISGNIFKKHMVAMLGDQLFLLTCVKMHYFFLSKTRKTSAVFADLVKKTFCQLLVLSDMHFAVWRDATDLEIAEVKGMFEAQQQDLSQVQLPAVRFKAVSEHEHATSEHDRVPTMTLRQGKAEAPSGVPVSHKRSRSRAAEQASPSEKKARPASEEYLTHEQVMTVKDIVKQTVLELLPQMQAQQNVASPLLNVSSPHFSLPATSTVPSNPGLTPQYFFIFGR